MIRNKNPQLIFLLTNLFHDFGIKYINLNKIFSMMWDKFQNFDIFRYLIVVDIKTNLRLY